MLFSTITFSLSITDLIEMLPDNGVTLVDTFHFEQHDIGIHIIMLSIDTVLYFVLAWYLDEVVERDWGSTKHWTFVFDYVTRKIKKLYKADTVVVEVRLTDELREADQWTEQVSSQVKSSGLAVQIRGLVKRFPGKGGNDFVVNLTLHRGYEDGS